MRSSNALAGRRVLLGVTGGIAGYKACLLARLLVREAAEVQAVLTRSATRFVGADTFSALTGREALVDPWGSPGSVLHVRLAHEADVAVVAPLTANVLAKLANGIADDLLTATLLETRAPLVLSPAMHTGMWEHPATQANVETMRARGAVVVAPTPGPLAAGDEGAGRLAEPQVILDAVEGAAADGAGDLAGRSVVVTAGPTWEPIDPVRFVGNRSSGRMGFAIARALRVRGAAVSLILGPGTVEPPPGVRVVRVQTAEEMRSSVVDVASSADAVVMAAAVADFRPEHVEATKLKKDSGAPDLKLVATADILAELGETKGDRILVGFAAETSGDVVATGRAKLEAKHLDLVVVNEVGREGTGFGADTNDAAIVSADGRDVAMRTWTKDELASAICQRLVELLDR